MTRMVYLLNAILVMNFAWGEALFFGTNLNWQYNFMCVEMGINSVQREIFSIFFHSSFPLCTIARLCICIYLPFDFISFYSVFSIPHNILFVYFLLFYLIIYDVWALLIHFIPCDSYIGDTLHTVNVYIYVNLVRVYTEAASIYSTKTFMFAPSIWLIFLEA